MPVNSTKEYFIYIVVAKIIIIMSKRNKRNPWTWIPTLYFAEGMPYIIVMFVASDMYKTMGVSNASLAFWTSILYLPWVIKPLWSPFVDIFSTRRKWIFWMQIILALAFTGISISLHLPWWFPVTLMFLWVMAFTSATQDIAADGFYMLALSEKKQAFFTGIRSTFYRLAMIAGLGLLVIITGLILDNTGLESKKITVYAVSSDSFIPKSVSEDDITAFFSTRHKESKPQIVYYPEKLQIPLYNTQSGTDSINVYFALTSFPRDEDSIKMTFGQKNGSKDIKLTGKSVFVFNKDNWNIPQKTTIKVAHNLRHPDSAGFDAKAGNIALAWSISIGTLAILFFLLAFYHKIILPYPKGDVSKDKSESASYWSILAQFFKLKGIIPAIAFLLFYRFSESQLTKMASPFLLDSRENGGLALSLTEKGFAYGTVGLLSLVIGGILGGIVAAKQGLKKWIWWMAISINIPNIVYIYMSYAQPSNLYLINSMIAIEQFGYGFGFTGYMLYMLYLASQSKYKTAHFAIATGFMALGMMIPGMISGWVQEMLGYSHFFIYVIICTIPSFIALWFVSKDLDSSFGMKDDNL